MIDIELDNEVFTLDYFNSINREELYIDSQYGYRLYGEWMPVENSRKTVVFCHGYKFGHIGSIKYVELFHRLGFNAFVYDHRYFGNSGGRNCTFGFKEKDDLKTVITYLKDRFGDDMIIGTHGESMGAATILQHGAIDNRVTFIVADCGFAGLKLQFKDQLKYVYRLPSFPFIQLASLLNKLLTGGFYKDISPMDSAKEITVPTLIIHGLADNFVHPYNARYIYENLTSPKRLYEVEEAGHARAYSTDKVKYFEELKEFLTENKIIE